MPRKLLFYTHAFGGGGAEVVFARLAAAFADAGDDVIFVADHTDATSPAARTAVRHVLLAGGHVATTRALARLIREERPDASFSALGAQNLKHLAAAILARRRAHCVLGYHGFAAAEPKPFAQASFKLAALSTRLAAHTICVSDVLLDDLRGRWRASRRRTSRIYNPLPPTVAHFVIPPDTDERRERLVLACGRLIAAKRFPDLVAAFGAVSDPTARLAILGEGPDRPTIKAAIARYGLEARVTLPGHVEDPSDWYRRASCVVIASESESFGLTAAEALAFGLPVVTTDCGGPSEILERGRYGRIVPIGDIEAMAAALTSTLAAPGDPAPRLARAQAFALPVIAAAYAALADTLHG